MVSTESKPWSDETITIDNTELELPERIGEAINKQGQNHAREESDNNEFRYCWWGHEKGDKLIYVTIKRHSVTIRVEYHQSVDGDIEMVDYESWEYETAGYAWRRLYRECGVDLDEHNVTFDFSL